MADKLFSEYIRTRDGRCVFGVKCKKRGGWEMKELQCCHFHSRRKESVRYDVENCDAGCIACHHYIDHTAEGQKWFDNFKLKQLGEQRYNGLLVRANTPGKRDDVMAVLYAKELLKTLKSTTPLP